MKSIIFTLAAVMVATVHAVRTNTLEKGASNWNDPNSYVDKSFIPGKQDVVFVQDQSTNFIYATDSASLDVVTNLSAIILKGQGKSSSLIIDVPEGMTNLLHCPVYGDGVYASTSWESGELVKRGSGWLDLISIGKSNRGFGTDYYTSINVENGTLRLPQTCNNDDGTENAQYCQVGYVTIGSSATFIPARYPENSARGVTYLWGLSGGGTLQGNPDSAYWFIVKGVSPYGPFSGKVVDYVRPRIENGGMLELTGIESTGFKYNAHRINNGTLAAVKFGNKQETSSLGATQILQVDENGGRLIYLGKGETSNRDFQLIPVNKPFYLDVTKEVLWGKENVLTVRVEDTENAGGIWQGVSLEIWK